jgi:general stress protein YciG
MVLTVAEAGRKGGKARMKTMTAEEREEVARQGGKTRSANLTADQRKKSASRAAKARWAKMDKVIVKIEERGKASSPQLKALEKKSRARSAKKKEPKAST